MLVFIAGARTTASSEVRTARAAIASAERQLGDVVLRDRRALAQDGMLIVVVAVDKQTGAMVGTPEIVTRGFVAESDARLLAGAAERIGRAIAGTGDHTSEIALMKVQIKDALSQFLYEQTRRRPMVFPVVVEV